MDPYHSYAVLRHFSPYTTHVWLVLVPFICQQEGAPPLSEDVLKVPKVTPLEFMRRSLGDKQFVILDTRNVSYLRSERGPDQMWYLYSLNSRTIYITVQVVLTVL